MNRTTTGLFWAGIIGALVLPVCTPVSTEPDSGEEPALLQLSLEEPGRTFAEFSGAPIPAIIELDRDTSFQVLTWHTGQGYPIYSDSVISSTGRTFTVELYWTSYPLRKDTAQNAFFDTVWVSMGGSLKKSNKVRIKVTNLPVVVDSARFDSTLFAGQDTFWQCSLPATGQQPYPFTIFARDLDSKQPLIQILGNEGKFTQSGTNPLEMEYFPPEGDFSDTVDFIIFDQHRGQAFRTLLVERTSPNVPPRIDSVQVKSTMLNAAAMVGGVYRVAFTSFDTLKLRAFAHDTLGTIKKYLWSAENNSIVADSTAAYRATYVCSDENCSDTLRDSSVVVDLITITVIDDRGDSAVRKIELSRGELNQPPKITSYLLDESRVSFGDTVANVSVTGGTSHRISVASSDPEGEDLSVTWTGKPSTRFSAKTDSTITYTAPAAEATDTLRLVVSDGKISITRVLQITVDDVLPRFDSLLVGDTVLDGPDSIFEINGLGGDTLLCIGYATDRDTARDPMSYEWSSAGDGAYMVKIENRTRYILPDSLIKDTIILILQDGEAQVVIRVVCAPSNRAPVIDSIVGDSVRLSGTAAFLKDTAGSADTITFMAFGHDPEGEKLTWSWSCSDSTLLSSPDSSSVDYYCRDSVYVDTISATIRDQKGASAVRKILLTVDSTTAP